MNEKVVVTGVGIVSPHFIGIGDDLEKIIFQNNVENDNSFGKEEINIGEQLEKHVPYKLIRRMCRFSQIALFSNVLCMKDSGINIRGEWERIGSIMNTSYGPLNVTEKLLNDLICHGPQEVSPADFSNTVNNCATGQVSIFFNLKGVSTTLIGSSAITYAYDLIRNGKADAVFVSGVEEYNKNVRDIMHGKGFETKELSCCILMESYEHAIERKAKIYSEITESEAVYGIKNSLFNQYFNADVKIKSTLANSLLIGPEYDNISQKLNGFACDKIFGNVLGAAEVLSVLCAAVFIHCNKYPDNRNDEQCAIGDEEVLAFSFQHGNCCSMVKQKGVLG